MTLATWILLWLALVPGARGEELRDVVYRFLEDDGWHPTAFPGGWTMPFRGSTHTWACIAVVFEDEERVAFYSLIEEPVPAERRSAVARYLTRANLGLSIGNFELDLDGGMVRFKTSADLEGGRLTEQMMTNLAYANVLTMNRYVGGLLEVVQGADPLERIRGIEAEGRR